MAEQTVGWIGLGSMGHRMAKHIAAAGVPMVCADKFDASKAPAGATVLADNPAVAAAAEIVILSLPAGPDVLSVVDELLAAPGRRCHTIVDLSTIGLAAAEAADAKCKAAGVAFVDAPVSGGTAGAEKATLSVIIGCADDAFERVKPALSHIGKNLFHVGPTPGQGQTLKLLNNFLSATNTAASCEAIAFGLKKGIDMATMVEVVNASTGMNSATTDKFPNRVMKGIPAGFTSKLLAKDVGLFVENARAAGTADVISPLIHSLFLKLEEEEPGSDFMRLWEMTVEGRTKG